MKTHLFHGGLYRETLRRLRLPALVMLVLFTVFDLLFAFIRFLDYFFSPVSYDLHELFLSYHFTLTWVPFVVPFVLMLAAFHYLTKRRDSDFYHSLPFTRTSLSLSMIAAVATWIAVIVIVPSVIIAVFPVVLMGTVPFSDVLLTVGGGLAASLFMMSLCFLSIMISGNTVSTVFNVIILLFGPPLFVQSLIDMATYNLNIVDSVPNVWSLSLLFPSTENYDWEWLGNYSSPLAWTFTLIATLVCFSSALWIGKRRPSETAGKASFHPAVQVFMRILLTMVCCLAAIWLLYDMYTSSGFNSPLEKVLTLLTVSLFLYVPSVVVYFLYELFTTRKLINLLKAIPWLGVVAVLNIACILGVPAASHNILHFRPAPADVNSVSLTEISFRSVMPEYEEKYLEDYDITDAYDYYQETYGLDPKDSLFGVPFSEANEADAKYYAFESMYNESDCTKARLTDAASIGIACKALGTALDDLHGDCSVLEHARGKEWAIYCVTIAYRTGLITRSRSVYITESELAVLLRAVDRKEGLPPTHFRPAL